MPFSIFETSRSGGDPIMLYRVTYGTGPGDFLALTDAEEDITIEGVAYRGRQAIHCPDITASGTLDKSTLELLVAFDSPLTELFRTAVPDNVITLRILRAHYGDVDEGVLPPANVIQIWGGRILNFEVDGDYQVTLSCEPIGTSLRRAGLRRPFCIGCPHILYGSACRADEATFSVVASVVTVDENTATLSAGWNGPFDPSKFARGVLSFAGPFGRVKRSIVRVSGDTLTLAGSLDALSAGAEVVARLGCDHTMDDCKNTFNNLPNYGGFPWIPTENPVGQKSFFY